MSDEELRVACLAPDSAYEEWPASWVRALAHEVKERRAADRTPIGRVAAMAQALPVNEEAERMVDKLMGEHYAKQPTRKLMPALSPVEVEALGWALKELIHINHVQDLGPHERIGCTVAISALTKLLGGHRHD
jgi:hypothetical protein